MYAQQQQQLILQQQNLLLPTLNPNAMLQPPSCYPGQAAQHAPAIQNQQAVQTGPMCQLSSRVHSQSCPQPMRAPPPQGAHGAACFPQPGNELCMRNYMPQLSNGQHQTYQQNGLWPGLSNQQVSSAPGGAQSPAAHHPVASQAWQNNTNLHQTAPTSAHQNPESSPRFHTELSYSQDPQITLQVTPGIPGNSEDAAAVQSTVATIESPFATRSCDSKDDEKTSSRIRKCRTSVSFSALSDATTQSSEAEMPPLPKQSVEEGPTEASATDHCRSPRCNGKNVPSHSLDDLFEEDDGIANALQEPKPVPRRAPSRKGSRPQILQIHKSGADVGNDNGCMIGLRGRQGSIPRAPLDPSLFATEEEDQDARARRQRAAADHEKAKRQTKAAGNPRCGECGVSPSCRHAWTRSLIPTCPITDA